MQNCGLESKPTSKIDLLPVLHLLDYIFRRFRISHTDAQRSSLKSAMNRPARNQQVADHTLLQRERESEGEKDKIAKTIIRVRAHNRFDRSRAFAPARSRMCGCLHKRVNRVIKWSTSIISCGEWRPQEKIFASMDTQLRIVNLRSRNQSKT